MTTSAVEKTVEKIDAVDRKIPRTSRAAFNVARRASSKAQGVGSRAKPAVGRAPLPSVRPFRWGDDVPCDVTPSWVGGDGAFRLGEDESGAPVMRRTFTSESGAYASPFTAVVAMQTMAGEAGIAPRVLSVDVPNSQVVTECKDAPWRRAKLDDFLDADFLKAVLRQRRRCHELAGDASVLVERSVVEDVYALYDACADARVPLPRAVGRVLARMQPFVRRVRAGAFALPAVPCHGDGAASNVLARFDGVGRLDADPLLTGWTVSGLIDPVEEAGSVVAELGMFAPLSAEGIVAELGLPTACAPAARAFAVLDDVRWALIGLLRTAQAADRSIDYAKYGLWRLTKCEAALEADDGVGAWLKEV